MLVARAGNRVGVIDTDIQSPGIHVLFQLDESRIRNSLNDYLWKRCKIEEAAYDVTDRCIGNVIRMAGVTLKEAVAMATIRPRELLGLPIHTLEVGQPAELVVFDWVPGGELSVRESVWSIPRQ